MDRTELWWDLAGPCSFLERVSREVGRGERVVCITAPDPRPEGFAEALARKLRSDLSMDCVSLDVSSVNATQPIPHFLAEMLDVPVADIGTVAALASHPDLADQIIIADGIQTSEMRRWSLFLRALSAERSSAIVGPVVIVLIPPGLDRSSQSLLCGSTRPLSLQGIRDRCDSISYLARIGIRPGQDLAARVGHSVSIDVAAWSREVLEVLAHRDVSEQIDPLPLLDMAAKTTPQVKPSWENGLIDLWDDEPVVHAVAAVGFGFQDQVRARVWAGQSSVLLPFTYRLLRCVVGRYRTILDEAVSPERPLRKQFGPKEVIIESPDKLEFGDVLYLTRHHITQGERDLLTVAAQARHAMAHRDLFETEKVHLLSEHYEANRHLLVPDVT